MQVLDTRALWPTSASPLATCAGLLTALAGPPLLAFVSSSLFERPPLGIQVVFQFALCAMAAIVLLIVRRGERLPLASIGVSRPTWGSVASALGLIAVLLYGLPLLTTHLLAALDLGDFQAGLDEIARQPHWWRTCVALSSGLIEETLYRGYAVERLATITGRLWLGGLIAALAFGAAHVPFWGLGPAVAANLPFGAIMVGFYVWRRDLLANAATHTVVLLIGMWSVPGVGP